MELSALAIFLIATAAVIGFIFGVMVAAVAAGPNARLEEVPITETMDVLASATLSNIEIIEVVRKVHSSGHIFARNRTTGKNT